MKTASWIILDATNKPVYETFSEKEAEAFNRKREYRAVPIMEYLTSLNKTPNRTKG